MSISLLADPLAFSERRPVPCSSMQMRSITSLTSYRTGCYAMLLLWPILRERERERELHAGMGMTETPRIPRESPPPLAWRNCCGTPAGCKRNAETKTHFYCECCCCCACSGRKNPSAMSFESHFPRFCKIIRQLRYEWITSDKYSLNVDWHLYQQRWEAFWGNRWGGDEIVFPCSSLISTLA